MRIVVRWQGAAIACAAVAWAQAAGAAPMRGRVVLRFESGAPAKEQTRFVAAVEAELASVVAVDAADTVVVVRVRWIGHAATLDFEDAAGASVAPSRSVTGETVDVVASQAASIVRATVIALREAATPDVPAAAPTSPIEPPPVAVPAPPPTPEPSVPAPRAMDPAADAASRSADGRRADLPQPASSSPAPALASPAPRITFGAFYTGVVYASEIPWRSGVRIETFVIGARRGGTWLYAGVGYGFDPAVTVVTPNVTLRTARHSAALIAGLGRAFGALRVGAEIAPLAADTLRTAQTTGDGFGATADHALLSFGGASRVRAALVTAHSHVDMSIGVTAFPSGEAYVVQSRSGEKSVFAPYRVQPEVSLGVGFDLW